MHMLRLVTGFGGMLTFMLTCITCTCYVTSLGWASRNGGKLSVIKNIFKRGSKAEPLCTGRRGHNASSCESLGQKLLSLLRKKHSVPQLQDFWRMNSKTKSLLEVTGRSLKNRMAMWEGKKHRAPFEENIPCKLQVIIEKTLQILGEFKACLENESVVSLWRKQHFFQSAHNPWRGFPPDGLFKKSCCIPSFILGRLECTLCIPFFGQWQVNLTGLS